jgi:hypothetical protein
MISSWWGLNVSNPKWVLSVCCTIPTGIGEGLFSMNNLVNKYKTRVFAEKMQGMR